MPRPQRTLALTLVLSTCLTANAHASAPAGVWALVDEVTLLPDGDKPTLVRIDGVLMIANVLPDFADYDGYSVPQVGYMYYSCEDKQLATCVMEWKELMAVAGTADDCRGWGSNSLPNNGVLRHPQLPMKDPDVYPVAQGVSPGFAPCEALRKWEMENAGATTTGEPDTTSGGDSTGGTDALTTTDGTGDGTTTAPATTGADGTTGTEPVTTGASDGPTTDTPTSDTGALTGEPGGTTGTNTTGTAETTGTPASDPSGDQGCGCDSRGEQGFAALALGLLFLRRRRRA